MSEQPLDAVALTALSSAGRGDTAGLLAALQRGASVDTADRSGHTLVFIAAQYGRTETVQALAERGAEVNAGDFENYTPVYVAARNGHTETVRVLARL